MGHSTGVWRYLINDPDRPTRIGNSVSRNTSPDLAFVKNIEKTAWDNTEVNVGSDHYILAITAFLKDIKKRKRTIRHTRWDVFRYARDKRTPMPITNLEDLEDWTRTVIQDTNNATIEAETEEEGPTPNSRLVHLWEAQKSIQKRWLLQKHNKSLRKKLVQLEKEIEQHCQFLSQEHWHQICD